MNGFGLDFAIIGNGRTAAWWIHRCGSCGGAIHASAGTRSILAG